MILFQEERNIRYRDLACIKFFRSLRDLITWRSSLLKMICSFYSFVPSQNATSARYSPCLLPRILFEGKCSPPHVILKPYPKVLSDLNQLLRRCRFRVNAFHHVHGKMIMSSYGKDYFPSTVSTFFNLTKTTALI